MHVDVLDAGIILFFLKFKNSKNLFFLMLFSFTLLINIVRFNPVMEDFSEFYNDLYNFDPKAQYVCDFWFDIME